jgi:cob(I)alamin adenosyltransferase
MNKGYIQVYTGNGKGKTTAALGLAVRAAGAGLKIFIAQFLKGRKYSELCALKKMKKNIIVKQYGTKNFVIEFPLKKDINNAKRGLLESTQAINSGKFDLVVLDEVFHAINLKLIQLEDVVQLLQNKPEKVEIVLTGRNAPEKIVKIADLATEMQEIKHYFTLGVKARPGIEY